MLLTSLRRDWTSRARQRADRLGNTVAREKETLAWARRLVPDPWWDAVHRWQPRVRRSEYPAVRFIAPTTASSFLISTLACRQIQHTDNLHCSMVSISWPSPADPPTRYFQQAGLGDCRVGAELVRRI